ncbi:MAG: phosphoenolpyruvate carboxykinase (GTP) [Oscillospiraceae bacterium]|jgi:phosphoenolpyruvate carboxykinase (GTP)|nr:phosphoenolpyruvate carboxykinase (GTP) [Oscillospiraceae bacterium]
MIKNETVKNWIFQLKELLNPEEIIWIDGSQSQLEDLKETACQKGILTKLNTKILPGCFLHRSSPDDVARMEDRTFICCNFKDEAGPTNNFWNPKEAIKTLEKILKNSYHGRTMYVIPFCMGQINSKFSKLGIEVTDSIYVVLNMVIMSRVGKEVFGKFESLTNPNDWSKCLHASCKNNKNERYICHFPQDNKVISVNSSYGGNALLGKKSLALRLASVFGRNEGWLAEHMLILGIKIPGIEEIKYICAAFPSGCGKTNLAMLMPPPGFESKGYKIWCVGDDIAWLRPGNDGRLWAINPENGFFGVCAGTDRKTNPNALETARKNTIFTNVVYDSLENTIWWKGLSKNPSAHALDWMGKPWDASSENAGAHPNSRFTAPAENCPCLSPEFNNPEGVPISAIIFGGRRSKVTPLIYESRSWVHGVFTGSIMSSETTAAATGKTGVLRHDPFGMFPFCGYNMVDYFEHWINIGKKINDKSIKFFNVNWFRIDEKGKFIWPGFGENIRVLEWIVKRVENLVVAKEGIIGMIPHAKDINIEGLGINNKELDELLHVDYSLWEKEIIEIENFYYKFGAKLPKELRDELEYVKSKLRYT